MANFINYLYESLHKSLFFKRLSILAVAGSNNYAPAMPVIFLNTRRCNYSSTLNTLKR